MPTQNEVSAELRDVVVRVVDCDPAAVVPQARLQDLGVDSLALVEVAEGVRLHLGRTIDDRTLDGVRTVQDLQDAALGERADTAPATLVPPLLDPALPPDEVERRKRKAVTYAAGFVGVGLVVGVVGGFGLAAVGKMMGLGTQEVPRAAATTPTPSATTPAPSATPTTPSASTTPEAPEAELSITPTSVSAGERMTLSGRLPTAEANAVLQVQTKDGDGAWTDFPVTVQVSDDQGSFTTQIYTTRTGERQIRLLDRDSRTSTPPATVTVG